MSPLQDQLTSNHGTFKGPSAHLTDTASSARRNYQHTTQSLKRQSENPFRRGKEDICQNTCSP
jgi:hypothetical protein